MSYAAIEEKLGCGATVLLDGGVGTEILRRGVYWRCHGIEQRPEMVEQVHEDYLRAGADILRTNTFQLNRRAYLNLFHGLEHMRRIGPKGLENKWELLTRRAVELSRAAIKQTGHEKDGAALAGVVSPLEHSFRPDLAPSETDCRKEHDEIMGVMKDCGVDFILLESMNTVRETKAACEAARAAGLPVWVSFVVRENGQLLSREALSEGVKTAEAAGADAILVNCAPMADITAALGALAKLSRKPAGAFAHIGRYDPPSWKFGFYPRFSGTSEVPPAQYLEAAREWQRLGAKIIGGCCGTTPDHIRALREGLEK